MKALLLAIAVVLAVIGIFFFAYQKASTPSPVINLTTAPSPTTQLTQTLEPSPTPEVLTVTTIASPTAIPKFKSATVRTSKGTFTIELYYSQAPNTVENFAQKAKSGFYQNLTFHRVEDWVIQGGDPLGDGTGGEKMPTELNDKPFVVGSVGVARGPDIKVSNDAQFFVTKTEAAWLNKQYTNFGIVTKGMDIVKKIEIGDKILSITVQ